MAQSIKSATARVAWYASQTWELCTEFNVTIWYTAPYKQRGNRSAKVDRLCRIYTCIVFNSIEFLVRFVSPAARCRNHYSSFRWFDWF